MAATPASLLRLLLLQQRHLLLLLLLLLFHHGRFTSRGLAHGRDVGAQIGHGGGHVGGEDVAEGGKGVRLAADELVAAADELDELARVNVRVAAVLDVLEQLGRDEGEGAGVGGRGVEGLEGAGEGFAGRWGEGVLASWSERMGKTRGREPYISLLRTSLLGRPAESEDETWTMIW